MSWLIRKRAELLQPGDQFVFADDIGGEGELVTVTSATNLLGTIVIWTEELDFDIEVAATTQITLKENTDEHS